MMDEGAQHITFMLSAAFVIIGMLLLLGALLSAGLRAPLLGES